MDCIYLDNNATTPLLPAVREAMLPHLTGIQGNPASAHQVGRRARQVLEDARERIAANLGAHPDEVIFTSGATEANNLAVLGLAGEPPAHLLVSAIEHPSVSEPFAHLAQQGFSVDQLVPDMQGRVRTETLTSLLREDTRLVAVMLANHETGALQPVREITEAVPGRAAVHCDAVQAVGKIPVHFHDLGVTTLALSAHKFHGPRGIGALLLRRGSKPRPLFRGGHQQQGRRPGTEPVALAAGMAVALDIAGKEMQTRTAHVLALRRQFLGRLLSEAAPVILNGPEEGGIPHTINLSFPGLRSDSLLMALDLAGVCCSAGSACSSGSLLPSPVLRAMGLDEAVLRSAVRFSLSPLISLEEVDESARRICNVVKRLQQHPLGSDFLENS